MSGLKYTLQDDVAVLTIENAPVNGLSQPIRAGLLDSILRAETDPQVRAIVITGAGRLFCAGADIREFGSAPKAPSLPEVLDRIELCTKPVVAAMHGVAAGGGLELALACHLRVSVSGTRVGLPEVNLGIVPGAGGTQRLPRLVGALKALELITLGELQPVDSLVNTGLIDQLVYDGNVVDAALRTSREIAADDLDLNRTRNKRVQGDRKELQTYIELQSRRWRGLSAQRAAAELVTASLHTPFTDGMSQEREVYLQLLSSDQAKALRHVFFAERAASKDATSQDVRAMSIQKAAVIGAGTMGGGIAMTFLNANRPVVLLDTAQQGLDRGIETIRKNYARSVSSGRLTSEEVDQRMSLLTATLDYEDLSDADIIVEAIYEDMAAKKAVFAELDRTAKPTAILATNTSTLDVDEIASATNRPEKVVGTHFFSPANVMKLMENVRARASSPEAVATIMRLGKDLGKVPVLVGVCFGFVGNRMLYAYTRQANFIIEEGATTEQVDAAIVKFGLPMGPFQMSDLTGIDVGYAIRKANRATMVPPGMRGFTVADRLAEKGFLGQKGGIGWYQYDEQRRRGAPNPEVSKIIGEVVAERGYRSRKFTDEEIIQRCMFSLVNEGAKILEEGIASRAGDIDVIWTTGYGFPRYLGGPMYWADQVGLRNIAETMKRLHQEVGEWCRPAPLLEKLAAEDKTFSQWSH